jgi:hypothetical protein
MDIIIEDIESLHDWLKSKYEITNSTQAYEDVDGVKIEHKEFTTFIKTSENDGVENLCQAAYRTIKHLSEESKSKKMFMRIWPEIKEGKDRISMYFRLSFIP